MENDLNKSISVSSGTCSPPMIDSNKDIDFFSLASPTAQQVFDHVVRGVVAQGRPSIDVKGHCAYRGLDHLKCAAGMVISDGEYDANRMEGARLRRGDLPERLTDHYSLLYELQCAHDSSANEDEFVAAFRAECTNVALRNKLNADAAHENPQGQPS